VGTASLVVTLPSSLWLWSWFSDKVVTIAGEDGESATTAMDFNPVHPSNAFFAMVVSDDGSSIATKKGQFPNAAFPIVRRDDDDDDDGGKVTWERLSQP